MSKKVIIRLLLLKDYCGSTVEELEGDTHRYKYTGTDTRQAVVERVQARNNTVLN